MKVKLFLMLLSLANASLLDWLWPSDTPEVSQLDSFEQLYQNLAYFSRYFEDNIIEAADLLITIKVDEFVSKVNKYLDDNYLRLADVIPDEYSIKSSDDNIFHLLYLRKYLIYKLQVQANEIIIEIQDKYLGDLLPKYLMET